MLELLRLWMIK